MAEPKRRATDENDEVSPETGRARSASPPAQTPERKDWVEYLAVGRALEEGNPDQRRIAELLARVAARYVHAGEELTRLRSQLEELPALAEFAERAKALIVALPECTDCTALATRYVGLAQELKYCDAHGGSAPDLPYAPQLRALLELVDVETPEAATEEPPPVH